MNSSQRLPKTFHRKMRPVYFCTVLLGIVGHLSLIAGEEYSSVARKLSSPIDDADLANIQLSNEDLNSLIAILEGKQRELSVQEEGQRNPSLFQHSPTIHPELIRTHSPTPPPTTTTEPPPASRVTARRIYRRLRRKTTTTESPVASTSATPKDEVMDTAGSGRMLPATGPADLLQQISLLNGILGALNATVEPSLAPALSAPSAPAPTANSNANINATSVNDVLAYLTGAKSDASSKSEVVVPPPPQQSQDNNAASAIALLNLFSGGNNNGNNDNSNANSAQNLLNLVAQSQASSQPQDTDASAALTKLLLQSSAPVAQTVSNSITQPQQQTAESANQLNNLLGLLGTLGAASGGGLQAQSNAGNINNLFNLGGDQQTAQAQTLASLFGGGQQQQQQQNLLNLFGGNQAGQGFSLQNLLAPQASTNSIPGLGLLSTMSSLGSSMFSTISNIFGGARSDGKPRVRGKGVDTRLGVGYRLGNVGDAQIVWDIGPQLFTDPLRNEMRPYQHKRESGAAEYLEAASAAAAEKEVQQIEAKRRMVQSAIHDRYKNDYDQFSSVYPTKFRRSNSIFDYPTSKPTYEEPPSTSPAPTSSSVFLRAIPFVDHIKGFWSGLTSGISEPESETTPSPSSKYPSFDDIRSQFSQNLIKRSSQSDYDFGTPRPKYPNRRMDDNDYDTEDANHSTLTDYERMLLQYGKDIGVGGVADTRHGVVEEPPASETSSIFSRWFKPSSSSNAPSKSDRQRDRSQEEPQYRRGPSNHRRQEWGPGSATSGSEEYPVYQKPPHKPSKKTSPYGPDLSYTRRNDVRNSNNQRRTKKNPRPQQRRSHNPFRSWIQALKPATSHHHHHQGQRPRASAQSQYEGFGRRHFKRPSANPKLQHFTNTNKDLMMADANIDDFVESAGVESIPGFDQPLTYNYGSEFPDVPLTLQQNRLRPFELPTGNYYSKKINKASLSNRESIAEPALLFDHLEILDKKPPNESDDSFHNRNKVVVNAKLREAEKKKVLGSTASPGKIPVSLSKLQRMRLNKLRSNGTGKRVVVKVRGSNSQFRPSPSASTLSAPGRDEDGHESSTAMPSVLSTISSLFSGTSKPKSFTNLIQNATSFLPSISNILILPRKKKKHQKAKITLENGKPVVIAPEPEVEDGDLEAEGDEIPPLVQVGEDMSFSDLQTIFTGSKKNNSTKRRFRIRVKESVLNGDKPNDKERKDSEEDNDEGDQRDIFVDIESGEVSVLKPVASLVSFAPKKEEPSQEEIDYYEDDDGDGVPDADMKRKEHIFDAIQKELVKNFEKMKKQQLRAEAKKRRKEELVKQGMDESMDMVTKFFNLHQNEAQESSRKEPKIINAGGLAK